LDTLARNRNKVIRAIYLLVLLVFFSGFHSQMKAQKATDIQGNGVSNETKYDLSFSEGLRYKMLGNPVEASKHFKMCTELLENRPAPYYELGNIALNMKDLLAAEGYAQTAVSLSQDNKWYNLLLIQIFVQAKRYTEAASLYNGLYNKYNEETDYLLAETDLLTRAEDFKGALKRLSKLGKIDGYEPEAALREKDIHLKMGKDKKAIDVLRKLADDYPDQIEYRGILAELLAEKGSHKEALKQYQIIENSNPDNPIIYYSLGQYYLDMGKRDEAIKEFEKGFASKQVNPDIKMTVFMQLVKDQEKEEDNEELNEQLEHLLNVLYEADKGHPGIDNMYANYLYDNEKFNESENVYKRVVESNPGSFMAWQNLLMIQNQQLDFDEMFSVSSKAVMAFPSQSLFFLFKGISANALSKYDVAVEALKKGSRLNAVNSEITKQYYISLGDALYHIGNYTEAFRNFDLLLVLDSENAQVLNNYAYYLSELGDDLEKALRMINKCMSIEPDNTTYLDTQAWVLYKLEKYSEALEQIEKVIAIDGEEVSGEVMEHYGDILYRNNKVSEAVESWKKAEGMEGVSEGISEKIEKKKLDE